MQKRFQEVYEQIQMPKECSRRIEQAMQHRRAGAAGSVTGYRWKPGLAVA